MKTEKKLIFFIGTINSPLMLNLRIVSVSIDRYRYMISFSCTSISCVIKLVALIYILKIFLIWLLQGCEIKQYMCYLLKLSKEKKRKKEKKKQKLSNRKNYSLALNLSYAHIFR